MPSPVHHQHEHGSRRSRSGGFPNVRLRYASIHVHGGHDRIVPYDPDFLISGTGFVCPAAGSEISSRKQLGGARCPVLFHSHRLAWPSLQRLSRRPVRSSSLRIGRPFLSGPLSIHAVPPVGRVFGTSLNIRHKFLSRCRPVSLRDKAFKPIRRRSDHTAKYLSAVPEAFHVSALSSALVASDRKHAAKVFGNVRKAVGKIRNV